jgi:O-antigen/teichoic acid export membrane protein
VIAAFLAMKVMPEVKLSLRAFDLGSMGDTAKFSAFAYLSTATNLVLAKTDQLVITTTLGVAAIVLYQSGAKVAEVFREFTKQVQESLSPAAAHLHAGGHRGELRGLMINATRWSVLIATPLYLLCAFYLHELLQLLTGEVSLSHETWLVGQVLLFWYYTSVITHSVSKRVFMMTGHERRLMWLGVAEASANLMISVGLALWMKSVVAVAIGSLIPTLWFGWMHLWRWMARDTGMSSLGLLRETVWPALAACVPALFVLLVLQHVVLAPGHSELAAMFIEATIAGLVAIVGLWKFALQPQERSRLAGRFVRQRPASVAA